MKWSSDRDCALLHFFALRRAFLLVCPVGDGPLEISSLEPVEDGIVFRNIASARGIVVRSTLWLH